MTSSLSGVLRTVWDAASLLAIALILVLCMADMEAVLAFGW